MQLLYRMSNLEELNLYLLINHNERFIDGNDLKNDVMIKLIYHQIKIFNALKNLGNNNIC